MTNRIKQQKALLRTELKERRARLTEELRNQYSRQVTDTLLSLPEIRSAGTIFIYISNGPELDTRSLIDRLLEDGKRLAIPKILNRETMVAVAFDDWAQVQPAELGILAPVSTQPLEADFDVIITPGLGFTKSGHRIGFGAGYYDRWFDQNPGGIRIAPAFEVQVIDEIPADEYDQPVHRIITEERDIVVPGRTQ